MLKAKKLHFGSYTAVRDDFRAVSIEFNTENRMWTLMAINRSCGGCDTVIDAYYTKKEALMGATDACVEWWTEL